MIIFFFSKRSTRHGAGTLAWRSSTVCALPTKPVGCYFLYFFLLTQDIGRSEFPSGSGLWGQDGAHGPLADLGFCAADPAASQLCSFIPERPRTHVRMLGLSNLPLSPIFNLIIFRLEGVVWRTVPRRPLWPWAHFCESSTSHILFKCPTPHEKGNFQTMKLSTKVL